MRFYVECKSHPDEKIYLQLSRPEPTMREQITEWFYVTCPQTKQQTVYSRWDVKAETGPEFLAGALVGVLLFLIDPALGIAGAIGGALGKRTTDQQKVDAFNQSRKGISP